MNSTKKVSFWEFFQGLGKTFMLPVALLGISGTLLGVGSAFTSNELLTQFPVLANPILQYFFNFITLLGAFTFSNLPVLFAMAIPLGLAREEKGVAAFSGFVGYAIMNMSINFYLTATHQLFEPAVMKAHGQAMIMGVQTINTGVLGGIIAGIIVYLLHNKFWEIKLPDSFAFFGGPRFIPIISLFTLSLVGLVIPIIWPVFNSALNGIGYVIKSSGAFGPFLFGAGERLLLPFGLHHILTAMIRFTPVGGEANINGKEVVGALNIFYDQLALGVPTTYKITRILDQGRMPSFFFGLPAAALAIYHTAKPENKKAIKGLLIYGVVSAIVGGITEPIEFLFLFVCPPLYLFHAFMTGLAFMVLGMLHMTVGPSGDIIGFVVFGVLQGLKTKWYLTFIVGGIWAVIYYFVFKWTILKWNLKTPGREDRVLKMPANPKNGLKNYTAMIMLEGLGMEDNIVSLDNCATRLRLVVKDMTLIDEEKLREAGAIGVVKLDSNNLQVVIGPQVHVMKSQLQKIINNK